MEEEEEEERRGHVGRPLLCQVHFYFCHIHSRGEDEDEEWHRERQFLRWHTNAQPLQMRIILDLFRYYQR